MGAATVSEERIRIFSGALSRSRDGNGAAADDFKVVVVVATIESQEKATGDRIAEEIGILVALVGHAGDQDFFFLEVYAVPRSGKHDVAAACVVIASDSEIQQARDPLHQPFRGRWASARSSTADSFRTWSSEPDRCCEPDQFPSPRSVHTSPNNGKPSRFSSRTLMVWGNSLPSHACASGSAICGLLKFRYCGST